MREERRNKDEEGKDIPQRQEALWCQLIALSRGPYAASLHEIHEELQLATAVPRNVIINNLLIFVLEHFL